MLLYRLGKLDEDIGDLPSVRHRSARAALPEGDFRDWPEIDAWATGIARELAAAG